MRKASCEEAALIALALEARKRGTSYGKLVAKTTAREQEKIVRKYKDQVGRKAQQGRRIGRGRCSRVPIQEIRACKL